ncbi:Pimeloyl-[acyl-carrier protein] methyl ester esterase [Buchnera aphidicola (Cinara pseudotaxifoliae)]|uniref:Pimeloyl-[acyl-carrier protein] methyl ester esterase n=1 Tax=Buchnera aphidicola (Cinara pseudotaxifoliae) TaxID=655384 RepID=A0A451DHU9_9GAMM|nr:alpha/beta fold hydrolase [Buchnera aphidicola]VFP86224.1 Pimeloyl-[acyl-carrier protein] methyl ester esterase [Buchnera aphidicola (Cinara pseudotaxifoliae)]
MNTTKKTMHWSVFGTGKINLVFLHGWGLHSVAWNTIIPILKPHFTLHTFDLPGFGENIDFPIMTFKKISKYLSKQINTKVIWIGWSMSGLIVHHLSLQYPHNTLATIYVNSSPCFIQRKNWPGIPKRLLYSIKESMLPYYSNFLKKFFLLHVIDVHKYKLSRLKIKEKLFKKYPSPKKEAIEIGYKWLTKIDHRNTIIYSNVPTLRIYGELDHLISKKAREKTDNLYQKKNSILIKGAKHAPFLSHPKTFCKIIYNFIKKTI